MEEITNAAEALQKRVQIIGDQNRGSTMEENSAEVEKRKASSMRRQRLQKFPWIDNSCVSDFELSSRTAADDPASARYSANEWLYRLQCHRRVHWSEARNFESSIASKFQFECVYLWPVNNYEITKSMEYSLSLPLCLSVSPFLLHVRHNSILIILIFSLTSSLLLLTFRNRLAFHSLAFVSIRFPLLNWFEKCNLINLSRSFAKLFPSFLLFHALRYLLNAFHSFALGSNNVVGVIVRYATLSR